MTTSPRLSRTTHREPLRLRIFDPVPAGGPEGAWWPRSRQLRDEGAALIDQFPDGIGRINRLLFSRPDWDDGVLESRGLRRIQAARGPVKTGSFPADDTHVMVLSMADGRRLRLQVIPHDSDAETAQRILDED